jgi:hypothetical protein
MKIGHRPILPGETVHRMTFSGFGLCGASERNGDRMSTRSSRVNCPKCLARVKQLRTEAKARLAALGV